MNISRLWQADSRVGHAKTGQAWIELRPMNGESQPLVIDEPFAFEKYQVKVQDFKKIIIYFERIYGIHLNYVKENQKIRTCN